MAYVDPNVDAEVVNPAVITTPQSQPQEKIPSFSEWLTSPEALALTAGILKASGPSPTPTSMGQALGSGIQNMLQAKLQFGNQNLEKQKFGYEQQFNAQKLGIENKRLGYEGRKVANDEAITRLHGGLYKAEADKIRNAIGNQNQFIGMLGGKIPATMPTRDSLNEIQPPNDETNATNSPGLLNNSPDQSQPIPPQMTTPSNGIGTLPAPTGVFANMTPEQRNMALMMAYAGHPEKIPEIVMGKAPDPYFTLSEGQVRFDLKGKPIAMGIPKDTKTPLEKQVISEGLQPGTPEYKARMAELNSGKELYTPIIKETIAEGFKPGTQEFEARIKDRANRANIQQQIKIPPGYTPVNGGDLSAGLVRIPGGPAEEVSSQDAGRIQMIRTAKKDIGESRGNVEAILFNKNPDGSINYSSPNRTNIFTANATGIPGLDSVPFSVGRDLRSAMEQGIQAITRIETGAAMPQSEIENTMTRFMPRTGDSDRTILLKWNRFKDFIGDANKLMDPSQRFETQRFKSDLSDNRSLDQQMGKTQSKVQKSSRASSMTNDQIKQILGIG